jgi:RNA polymerase sigma factor (sigma-70 family)
MRPENEWPTTRSTLLGRLRNPRDAHAWHGFVELYLPLIYSYSRRRGLQDADARNVAQEVLLQVCRSIRSFEYDPERGRFRNWIGLITHQRIIRHSQKETAAVQGLGDGLGDAIGNAMSREIESEWLDAFNAHLYRSACAAVRDQFDEICWRAFVMVWENGEDPQCVARQLERETQWVYQAKFRVLQRVKQQVLLLCTEMQV